MLLMGPTGSGKTTIAAALCLSLLDADERSFRRTVGIRWYSAVRLVGISREHSFGAGRCPEVDKAAKCRLLVLDDIGNGDRGDAVLFDILNERKEAMLPVIGTTGLTPKELRGPPYGNFWVRRLLERDGKLGNVVVAKGKA